MIRCFKITIAMLFVTAIWTFIGCDGNGRRTSSEEAVALIQAASKQRDYNRILTLADSLEKRGDLSLGESYFWQGLLTTVYHSS